MLINAIVSHELRNPLNSLIAQNLQKQALYKRLNKCITESKLEKDVKQKH